MGPSKAGGGGATPNPPTCHIKSPAPHSLTLCTYTQLPGPPPPLYKHVLRARRLLKIGHCSSQQLQDHCRQVSQHTIYTSTTYHAHLRCQHGTQCTPGHHVPTHGRGCLVRPIPTRGRVRRAACRPSIVLPRLSPHNGLQTRRGKAAIPHSAACNTQAESPAGTNASLHSPVAC